jgi:methylglyoxal synthase/pSer/pThr/pTyr-binding forkhead associated (FHA) protein
MRLKVLNSQTLSESQELDLSLAIRIEGEYLVGRSPNSGLVLDSPDVSRLHGKFLLQNGNYYYCDLGSRNGSLVNGRMAETNQKYVLKPGDIIRLGEFVLMLEEITPPDLPETVVRVVDATVVSNSLRNQQIPLLPKEEEQVLQGTNGEVLDLKTPDSQQIPQPTTTEEQPPEVVHPQATPVSKELTYVQMNEYTYVQPQPAESEQIDESTTEELIPEVVEREPASVNEELTYVQMNEYTYIQPKPAKSEQMDESTTEELVPEAVEREPASVGEEPTYVQLDEYTVIQPSKQENEVLENAIAFGANSTQLIATTQLEEEVPGVVDDTSEQIVPHIQHPIEPDIEEASVTVTDEPVTPTDEVSIDILTNELTSIDSLEQESEVLKNQVSIDVPIDEVTPINSPDQESPAQENNVLENQALIDVPTDELTPIDSPEQESPAQKNDVLEDEIVISQEEVPVVADDASEQILLDAQHPIKSDIEEPFVTVTDEPVTPSDEASIDVPTDELTPIELPEQESQVLENQAPIDEPTDEVTLIDSPEQESPEQEDEVLENEIATPQLEDEVPVVADDISDQITPNSLQMSQVTSEEHVFAPIVTQEVVPTSETPIDVPTTGEDISIQPVEENNVADSTTTIPQPEAEVLVVADDISEQTISDSQQIEQSATEEDTPEDVQSSDVVEDDTSSETPEFIDKYVVLIAHDTKRSELVQIMTQHQKLFSRCLTLASSSINDLLAQQSSITISQQLPAATSGGYQTIASMVSSGDVVAVIFLRDLLVPQLGQANEEALLRLCNINNLLVATNSSTAEAIVHYLETAKR